MTWSATSQSVAVAVVVGEKHTGWRACRSRRFWMNWINMVESTARELSRPCSSQSRGLCVASRPASLHNWIGRARYGSGIGQLLQLETMPPLPLLLPSLSKFMSEPRRRRTEIVRTPLSPSLRAAVNDRYLTALCCGGGGCCCRSGWID